MNQNEQGMLYPFRLSGSRMRQSANQLRRHGQALDALALVRRAAEQDDTPSSWQALAAELRQLGNWEAAAKVLARVLSRDAHQPGAWMDMARCMQGLGQNSLAMDCAYRQLHEDPWSPEGDAARALLRALETPDEAKEPRRTQRMIHRGLTCWQTGDRALGERRVRRALRMAADPERLLVTAAMICMLEADVRGALGYLARALRERPWDTKDARTLTAASTVYHQLGKRRIARGFLHMAAEVAVTTAGEDSFLTTAWAQDAWPELQAYLDLRMKSLPHRLPLLSAKATMLCETGNADGAADIWREILAIDPDDRTAASMLSQRQKQPDMRLVLPGMIPRPEKKQQMTELLMAAESLETAELLRCGGTPRRLLDWMLESSDPQERKAALELLQRLAPCEAATAYLKELLCRPILPGDVRQEALVHLAKDGPQEELLMLSGGHFDTVQCQPLTETQQQKPWRMFLPLLLTETRRYGQCNGIAEFAVSLWQCMSDAQRMEAASSGRYVWCKAMEILYLRMAGEEARAARVAARMPISPRRVSRVLRRLTRCLGDEIRME